MIPERTKKQAPEAVPVRPAPPIPEDAPEPGPRPRRRRWLWGVAIVLIVGGLYLLTHRGRQQPQNPQGTAAAGGKGAQRPVPVLATAARTKDIGVYLTGLGNVAPLNTVNVKSRVDGQLLRIDFREGQIVQGGALLAELDPRPFQVQLMQAEGLRAKDE